MNLQVCHENENRDMGTVALEPGTAIAAEDMAALAVAAHNGYGLSYDLYDGDTYELRVWDEEDCVWSATYVYADGTLTPTE